MSYLWMDDPSYYNTAELTTRYPLVGSLATVTAGGRFGGNCWSSGAGGSLVNTYFRIPTLSSIATGTLAFSFKFTLLPIGTVALMAFYDSATVQIDLRMNLTGNLLVTRNGTQIGSTSTNALAPNVWNRIEFQATINNTTGNIEVRVNGTSVNWIPSTGSLNTRNTTNNTFNQAVFGGLSGGNFSAGTSTFNDALVTDSNSPNAGFRGDKRFFPLNMASNSAVAWTPTFASDPGASVAVVLNQQFKDTNGNVQMCTVAGTTGSGARPTWSTTGGAVTSDGGTVKWTCRGSGSNPGATNWMAVSEGIADGDFSYNADSTPGDIDLFGVTPLPAGAQNIDAVNNVRYWRKDDAGVRSGAGLIKSNVTTATGATVTLSTSYTFDDQIQQTDPDTSAAWTVSGVNNMLPGYKEIA